MPRRSNTNKIYRNLKTYKAKKPVKCAKKKAKPVEIPTAPSLKSSRHDEEQAENKVIVAQIHQLQKDSAHEETIIPKPAIRNSAVLSDPKIIEILESSQSQSRCISNLKSETLQSQSQLNALLTLAPASHLNDTREKKYNKNVINFESEKFTELPISPTMYMQKVIMSAPQDQENNIYYSQPTLLPNTTSAEKVDKTISITCEKSDKLPMLTRIAHDLEPHSPHEKTPIPKPAFRNGAVLSDPDFIEILESSQSQQRSQPTALSLAPASFLKTTANKKLINNDILNYIQRDNFAESSTSPSKNTQEVVIRTSHHSENDVVIEEIERETFAESPVSPSTITQEVIIRTSHDLENDVVIEEIDILSANVDQPMDTSTPIGSPSISTILQNIESENLISFNINTPTSSICANSPIHDDNYAPSSGGETSITTYIGNTKEKQLKKKRKVKKKTDIGRIRKVNKSEWIDTKRKELKNRGLSYISRNGKLRPEKALLPSCDEQCRLKCKNKIDEDVRKQMFTKYWSLGDRVRQWDLLSRWCARIGKRRITTEGPSKRMFSIKYSLPVTLGSAKDERVTVCKNMFLNTFAIGEGIVRTALNKIADGNGLLAGRDERGHHDNHPKVKNDEMIKSVCNHVNSFCPVESHYTRKESSKLYLDGDLTMTKMFKLYNEWVPESHSNKAITLRQYTDIVNENFNIEFHRPKKDQCDECIAFKNLPKPVNQEVHDKYKEHLRNKERARTLRDEDKLSAINSPDTTVTAAFDFQKVLSSPHAATSILYYKRKLNVFNFTIFEMGKKVGYCYMWHEGIAKRGANEVASCVYDFIKEQSKKGVRTINLYSDNCSGQNRNRIVFMMYLIAAKEFKVNITHRFFEKGHTQNENDSIHALIERRSKGKEIYTPYQWFALVRWAKETGEPYIVKEIATEDIIDFKKVLAGKNWTKNEKNQKIMWSKTREVHVTSTEPNILHHKFDFNDTYQRIIVRRTQNRRRQNHQDDEITQQAYSGPLPIPEAKLVDIKYRCEHNIIPRQYHGFYNSLASGHVVVSSSDED